MQRIGDSPGGGQARPDAREGAGEITTQVTRRVGPARRESAVDAVSLGPAHLRFLGLLARAPLRLTHLPRLVVSIGDRALGFEPRALAGLGSRRLRRVIRGSHVTCSSQRTPSEV